MTTYNDSLITQAPAQWLQDIMDDMTAERRGHTMFTQTDNYLHGVYIYSPSGHSVREGMTLCDRCDRCILHRGETVTVQSLWYRNAYPGDPLLLAYVRGEHTGEHTHVPAGELIKYIS